MLDTELYKIVAKSEELYNNNRLLKAEEFAGKAFRLSIKENGYFHIETANTLVNLAVFLFYRKQFDKSTHFFKEVIKICTFINNTKNSILAINYNGLGYVLKKIGDYKKAHDYYNKAKLIGESIDDSFLPIYYFDIARIQKITNKIQQAFETFQKSIISAQAKIAQTKSEHHKYYEQIIYNCYNDLSEIYITKNDIDQAKRYHRSALWVLENSKSSINNFFEAYKRFEILAKMLVHEKKYNKAIELFNQAQESIVKEYRGFEVGKDLANIIHQIGECYNALDKHKKALATYQNALKAVCNDFQSTKIEDLPVIEQIYNKRSAIASLSYKAATWLELYNEKNDKKFLLHAFKTYQLIKELLPVTRRDYIEENSKFQLADETKGIYEKAIGTCLQLHKQTSDGMYLEEAFQFVESSKAIVLQEKLQADFALKGVEENVQQQDMDFRSKIAFYQNSINTNKATKGDENQLKDWQSKLWECKEAYERFQQKIEEENPSYYSIKYAQSVTKIDKLQDKLQADIALVEYFTGKENLYVFVIAKNTYSVYQSKTCSTQQQADIQLYKKLIYKFNKSGNLADYESFKTLGYQLYQKLLEPALLKINKSINSLIIIPDGLLYHITFEALLTSKENHHPSAYYHPKNLDYVCKNYAVSYSYSASLLSNSYKNEDYSYNRVFTGFAPTLKDLHHNKREVTQINQLLKGEVLLDKEANLKSFHQKANESKIIHLATHAQCSDEDMKLNRIDFNDKENLDSSAIENMKTKAGLVVLSACETGFGSIQSGEGAMSLARSFYLAGCPSLVASLWRANDKSTAKIMLYFYQYLKDGATKDVALQKAKLQYCKEAGLRESHPFYWAGFVQYGNRRPLF